jgi:hypothetical protein
MSDTQAEPIDPNIDPVTPQPDFQPNKKSTQVDTLPSFSPQEIKNTKDFSPQIEQFTAQPTADSQAQKRTNLEPKNNAADDS